MADPRQMSQRGDRKPRLFNKIRPVDLLPIFFLFTVSLVSLASPYPMYWDSTTVGAWAVFTLIAALIIAAPSVIRLERDFLQPKFRNLPGHVLLLVLLISVLFFAPQFLVHPATAAAVITMTGLIYTLGRGKRELFTFKRMILAWLPPLISFFVYENLRSFIGSLNPRTVDDTLAAIDLWIFGVHHSVWAEQFIHPWVTEWFSFHYGLYLLYPVLTGMLFYYHEQKQEFENFTLAFCLAMYLGFICYLLVPACGPIQGLTDHYHLSTVTGLSYSQYQAAVMEKFRYIRDAFPSLHVGNSLVCLFSLWRSYPRLAKVMIFFEVNLILSTIYLRMHYTIDIFAGAALALFVVWIAPKINRWAGIPRVPDPL